MICRNNPSIITGNQYPAERIMLNRSVFEKWLTFFRNHNENRYAMRLLKVIDDDLRNRHFILHQYSKENRSPYGSIYASSHWRRVKEAWLYGNRAVSSRQPSFTAGWQALKSQAANRASASLVPIGGQSALYLMSWDLPSTPKFPRRVI